MFQELIGGRWMATASTRRWSHNDLSQIANGPPWGSGLTDFHQRVGCVRPDGANAVFFTGNDRHIHQLRLSADTWVHSDISLVTNDPGNAAASPAVCVRPDRILSVVYIGRDFHIHELQMNGDMGSHVDLTDLAGSPKAAPTGSPAHFVRADGVVVIVYLSFPLQVSKSSMHQLAFTAGNWSDSNLSELTQFTVVSQFSRPAGYVRP